MKSMFSPARRIVCVCAAALIGLSACGFAQSTNCVPPPSGLVAWWQAESNALDSVGTNNGIAVGALGFGAGEVRQAFSFDGTTSYVRVPASASLNVGSSTNGLTLEAWIKPHFTNSMPICDWSGFGTYGVHFWVNQNGPGSLYGNLPDASGNHILQSTAGIVPVNVFSHVALTYDKASGIARLYVNGAVVGETDFGSIAPRSSSDLYIGGRSSTAPFGAFYFNGLIDEFSLYARALSTAEIAAIYNAGTNGKCMGPTPPFIFLEPTNQSVAIGGTVAFSVLAGGTAPLSYQWMFNSTNLTGETNTLLTLAGVQTNQAGVYAVLVTNTQPRINKGTNGRRHVILKACAQDFYA